MLEQITELFQNNQLNKNQDRLFSQLKYGYVLSKEQNGKFDSILLTAENYIRQSLQANDIASDQLVVEVEKLLEPLAEIAKSYEVLCVAHAHIDMNWQWGYDETVTTVIDTMQTMLQVLKEYPEYTFSQSQASVYKILNEYRPDMIEEIKQYIKEGRWEVTASTWVEADKNMPIGESHARHLLYTKTYLTNLLDVNPNDLNLDFEPDTFGHSENVPEVLSQAGVKYYYHCRGEEETNYLYRWVAPSGAEVLAYREPNFYNAEINSSIAYTVPEIARITKNKTILKVYGVGNHGGGPTRRDIQRILDMSTWPIYPKLRFATYKEYFEIVEKSKDLLPVMKGERNFLCDGCLTSQSKIKKGNRQAEKMLYDVEAFSVTANQLINYTYPVKPFEQAWQKVLFNQFHDILTGSCVDEAKAHAIGTYQEVFATAKSIQKNALQEIANKIDTSKFIVNETSFNSTAYGSGSGNMQAGQNDGKTRIFHVFNPLAYDLKKVTQILVWDYEGDFNRILVEDENNIPLEFQLGEKGHYWGHNFTELFVEVSVPAHGYTTCVVKERPIKEIPLTYHVEMREQHDEIFVLENDLICVKLSTADGSIESMIDKKTNIEMVDSSRKCGVFRLAYESKIKQITHWGGGMTAWFTGRYKSIENLNQNIEIKPVITGKLKNAINYLINFKNSNLSVTVSLDKDSSSLKYDVECDWREFGDDNCGVPVLGFYLPLPFECESYRFDVPFGVVDRKPMDIDLPANSTVFALPKEKNMKSLALVTNSKYGFRCKDNDISLTLIRSSYDPDKYPEIGSHTISFYVNLLDANCESSFLINKAVELNTEFSVIANKTHSGVLPLTQSVVSIEGNGFIVSSVKMDEKDANKLIVRMYETEGENQSGFIKLLHQPKCANLVDINEKLLDLENEVMIKENEVHFHMEPNKIMTISIEI